MKVFLLEKIAQQLDLDGEEDRYIPEETRKKIDRLVELFFLIYEEEEITEELEQASLEEIKEISFYVILLQELNEDYTQTLEECTPETIKKFSYFINATILENLCRRISYKVLNIPQIPRPTTDFV